MDQFGAQLPAEAVYVTKEVEIEDDSDGEFDYSTVPVDTTFVDEGDNESFNQTLKMVQDAKKITAPPLTSQPRLVDRPEVVEDFVRNFLVRKGMTRTLNSFQAEWYELKKKGAIQDADSVPVPDCYTRNNELQEQIDTLLGDQQVKLEAVAKAGKTVVKTKKERDYHRLAHRGIKEECKELTREIERLHDYYENVTTENETLQKKYETTKRRGVLLGLERDRTQVEIQELTQQYNTLAVAQDAGDEADAGEAGEAGAAVPPPPAELPGMEDTGAAVMPLHTPTYLALGVPDVAYPMSRERAEALKMQCTFQAHDQAVSAMAFHGPTKQLATASDTGGFKIWDAQSAASAQLLSEGDAHKYWIGGLDFHPTGDFLASSSGDGTVKLWDIQQAECLATFNEHTQAVWDCAFHYSGNFLASCSLDNSTKVWDMYTQQCRSTLRGHVDSVNSIDFQSDSNTLVTASADATVQIWDARTNLATLTLKGHGNACNHAVFNRHGNSLASADADGVVKLWDVRTGEATASFNAGPAAANRCAFDPSGAVLAVACGDKTTKILDATTLETITQLGGYYDSVESVLFEPSGKFLVSCAADGSVHMWDETTEEP